MPTAWRSRTALFVLLAACALHGWSHGSAAKGRLPIVGTAPEFALTDQFGDRVALADLRGKVLAVTFIYASCKDTCPLLTAKMAVIQRKLGADFGPRVRFASITVEPEIDTPAVLKSYAAAHSVDVAGWSFLTGSGAEIRDVDPFAPRKARASGGVPFTIAIAMTTAPESPAIPHAPGPPSWTGRPGTRGSSG